MILLQNPNAPIENFNLNEEERRNIANVNIRLNAKKTLIYLQRYDLSNPKEILLTALRLDPDSAEELIDAYYCSYYTDELISIQNDFATLNSEMEKTKNEAAKEWWRAFKIVSSSLNETEIGKYTLYAKEILKFENPSVRYILLAALVNHGVPDRLELQKALLQSLQEVSFQFKISS